MNWSRSVVAFSGGGARAHLPGVAPEASVECFDSSKVFLYVLFEECSRIVACPAFLLGVWFFMVQPPARAREVDQSLGRLLSFDPHAPFLEKKEEGGERHTTLVWASSDGL
jgi:hypothetical protein